MGRNEFEEKYKIHEQKKSDNYKKIVKKENKKLDEIIKNSKRINKFFSEDKER